HLYSDMHRFIPAVAAATAGAHHRDSRAAPPASLRQEQVRPLPRREGAGRSSHHQDDPLVPRAAARPLRPRRRVRARARYRLRRRERGRLARVPAVQGQRNGLSGRRAPLVRPRAPPPAPRARGRGLVEGEATSARRAPAPHPRGGTLTMEPYLESARVPGPSGDGSDVSVIVPVAARPEPLDGVYEEYAAPLREAGYRYEFIFAAEPWRADYLSALQPLRERGEPIRSFVMGQTVGESAPLKAAAFEARGPIVVTLPAYRRVDASVLPGLIRRVEAGADLALAYRWPRRDAWINRVQGIAFHAIVRRLVGDRTRDVACGVRAMRRDVLRGVPL